MPSLLRYINVALLPLLRAARQQEHKKFTVSANIDPVSRTEVHAKLENARTHALAITEVPARDFAKTDLDTGADDSLLCG